MCSNVTFREVANAIKEASETASATRPRTLMFRPSHAGPAEIAAPWGDDDDNDDENDDDDNQHDGGEGSKDDDDISLPDGVEVVHRIAPLMITAQWSSPSGASSEPSMPATFVRLEATPGLRRLPEMWCCVKDSDCGMTIELEFTTPPMGIVFQVRVQLHLTKLRLPRVVLAAFVALNDLCATLRMCEPDASMCCRDVLFAVRRHHRPLPSSCSQETGC